VAFTEPEKVKIRYYLGWGDRFRQTNSALEQAILAVENNSDTVDYITGTLLADLDSIVTSLVDARKRLKAEKVGSITLPMANEIAMLRSEGRRLAQSLAATLNVQTNHDVFSSSRNINAVGWGTGSPGNYYPHG
jgi:hypothetical protein